jgi:hypothetical protein
MIILTASLVLIIAYRQMGMVGGTVVVYAA